MASLYAPLGKLLREGLGSGCLMKCIGIDLDNTLIDYDEAFRAFARERGLVPPEFDGDKDELRQIVRDSPGGELAWQRLQGAVYGRGIQQAVLFDGVASFLERVRDRGCEVVIVSHKTEFGHFDPDRVNLRSAALEWLERQRFFCRDGFAIDPANVFFADTRAEKIAKICALSPRFFIDDLPEVLEDSEFPASVTGILFRRGQGDRSNYPRSFAHWNEIAKVILA